MTLPSSTATVSELISAIITTTAPFSVAASGPINVATAPAGAMIPPQPVLVGTIPLGPSSQMAPQARMSADASDAGFSGVIPNPYRVRRAKPKSKRIRQSSSSSSDSTSSSSSSSDSSAQDISHLKRSRVKKRIRKASRAHARKAKAKFETNRLQLDFNNVLAKEMSRIGKLSKKKKVQKKLLDCIRSIEDRNRTIQLSDTYGYDVARQMQAGNEIGLSKGEQDRLQQILFAQTVNNQAPNASTAATTSGQQQRPFRFPRGAGTRYFNTRPGTSTATGSGERRQPKPTDSCHYCGQYGHWKSACPLLQSANRKREEPGNGSSGNN